MADDWKRAGDLVAIRRRACGFRTQPDFAKAIGVSESTIGNLENGRRVSYSPGFLETVETALGWTHGSIMRTVQGGHPRQHVDPYLARIHAMWPTVHPQTRKILVDWLENALRD